MGEHFGWQQIKDPDTRQIIRGLQEANIKKHKELEKLQDDLCKLVEAERAYLKTPAGLWREKALSPFLNKIEKLIEGE